MIRLRNWLKPASLYCLSALIANILIAMILIRLPEDVLLTRLLSTTFSFIVIGIAIACLMKGIVLIERLLKIGLRATGWRKFVAFLVGGVLIFLCGVLVWILFLRLRQPFGTFLLNIDATLMQIDILGVAVWTWRYVHHTLAQQNKKP